MERPVPDPPGPAGVDREELADRLKERIYITFTALAIVLVLSSHPPAHAGEALGTLAAGVVATTLAVFVADVIARLAVNSGITAAEVRRAAAAPLGALSVLVIPTIVLVLAILDVMQLTTALRVSAIALIVALVAIGFLAVRRIPLRWWQRAIAWGAEAVLGLLVIGLELLAHG